MKTMYYLKNCFSKNNEFVGIGITKDRDFIINKYTGFMEENAPLGKFESKLEAEFAALDKGINIMCSVLTRKKYTERGNHKRYSDDKFYKKLTKMIFKCNKHESEAMQIIGSAILAQVRNEYRQHLKGEAK